MKEIDYDKEPSEKNPEEITNEIHNSIPTMRTFRADVEDLIKEKGETRTSIALAEAARRESRGEERFPVEDEPNLGGIIFVLLLVVAFSIGVGGYAIFGTRFTSFFGETATSTPRSPTTDNITVDLTASPHQQVLADISIGFGKTYLPTGGHRSIIFNIKDEEGKRVATASEFFTAVADAQIPQQLNPSLTSDFTYQVYSSSTLSGIVTLHTRSYANTFATMLEWEPLMAQGLIPALNPWYPKKSIRELKDRAFKDEFVEGVNVRTLTDLDGNSVLAYGFTKKQTLVIAGTVDGLRFAITDSKE